MDAQAKRTLRTTLNLVVHAFMIAVGACLGVKIGIYLAMKGW